MARAYADRHHLASACLFGILPERWCPAHTVTQQNMLVWRGHSEGPSRFGLLPSRLDVSRLTCILHRNIDLCERSTNQRMYNCENKAIHGSRRSCRSWREPKSVPQAGHGNSCSSPSALWRDESVSHSSSLIVSGKLTYTVDQY